MKNSLGIFVIGVVVLIVIIVGVAGFYIGPIVKIAMEQIGPKVTKVSVRLDEVSISLLSGSASIKGLAVGNPPGYSTARAISVSNIAVSLDPLSLTSKKVLIHSVRIQSPEITYEGGLNSNNLSKILDNVNTFSKNLAPSDNAPASNTVSKESSNPVPKIEVDDILITGARVHVNISGLGNKDIALPDIHLTDLGKDNDGLTPAELTSEILNAVSTDTVKTVASTIANLTHGVEGLGKGAFKTAGNSIKDIASSFGGLLGK